MFKIIRVLKTKNKELVSFENMEALKWYMKKEFWNYELLKPYIRTNFEIIQTVKKWDYRVKETYKNIIVSPSDDLFIYLTA